MRGKGIGEQGTCSSRSATRVQDNGLGSASCVLKETITCPDVHRKKGRTAVKQTERRPRKKSGKKKGVKREIKEDICRKKEKTPRKCIGRNMEEWEKGLVADST